MVSMNAQKERGWGLLHQEHPLDGAKKRSPEHEAEGVMRGSLYAQL